MFAQKIRVEVLEPGEPMPCPEEWLDSYSMRNFTGRSAFDDTLPAGQGLLEAGFGIEIPALQADMEDWMTRKFGTGRRVRLRLTPESRAII